MLTLNHQTQTHSLGSFIKYSHLHMDASTTTHIIMPWLLPEALPRLHLYSHSCFRAPGSLILEPSEDYYVLLSIQNGKGTLHVGQETVTLLPTGSFFFHPLDTIIRLYPSDSLPIDVHLLIIEGESIQALWGLYQESDPSCIMAPTTCNAVALLDSLMLHLPCEALHSQMESSSILHQLLTVLTLEQQQYVHSKASVPSYIYNIQHMFDTDYAKTYTLQNLCEQYHISKCKLTKDFQRYLKDSPIHYLLKRRLEVAKNLLLTTDDSICCIAQDVGIPNTNHFTNLFKKNVGQTPNQYRKDHKGYY